MVNLICSMILILILGSACLYIYKSKKNGIKCIGCPSGAKCSCGCGASKEKAENEIA